MKSLACFLLAFSTIASAKPPADLQARLDAFTKDEPGGAAVAWIDDDGPAFFTAGTYSASDTRPITPDTQFEIGSISKVFTALLLAESERLGKVSRGDSAANYLLPTGDPAQTALAKITLLSLATHTSDLPRLPSNLSFQRVTRTDPYAAYDRADLVAGLRLDEPSGVVGQKMIYSNFGASVLGEALAAAWGTSYAEALQTYVLGPLKLKKTSVGLSGLVPAADLAPAHSEGQRVPNWTWQACAGCGGIRSTARDMAAFLASYLEKVDTSLGPAMDATLVPQFASEKAGGHIGLAWMLLATPTRSLAWHNGATAGSHSFVAFDRKSGEGIVILTNNSKECEDLGFGLLSGKPSPRSDAIAP